MPGNANHPTTRKITFRGDRLRKIRRLRDIPAHRIARATGMATQHIYRLERNESPQVRGITIAKLAVALRVSTDYLLNLTDSPTPPPQLQKSEAVDYLLAEGLLNDEGSRGQS